MTIPVHNQPFHWGPGLAPQETLSEVVLMTFLSRCVATSLSFLCLVSGMCGIHVVWDVRIASSTNVDGFNLDETWLPLFVGGEKLAISRGGSSLPSSGFAV